MALSGALRVSLDSDQKAPGKAGGGKLHSEFLRVLYLSSHTFKKKTLNPSHVISNVPLRMVGKDETHELSYASLPKPMVPSSKTLSHLS